MQVQTLHKTIQNPPNPPKRSMDAERLLQWAYAEWCVDVALKRRDILSPVRALNAMAVERLGLLGTVVTGGSAAAAQALASMEAALPEDAVRVHDLVQEMAAHDAGLAALVVRCASTRTRPDCYLGIEPRCVPVMERGRPLVEMCRTARRPSFCLITWEPCSPREVDEARAAYSAWLAAVRWVGEEISAALETIAVRPPEAPEAPWRMKGLDAATKT